MRLGFFENGLPGFLRKRKVIFWVGGLVIAVLYCSVLIWERVRVIQLVGAQDRLVQEIERLKTSLLYTRQEVDRLLAYNQIVVRAEDRFGLNIPAPEQLVFRSGSPQANPTLIGRGGAQNSAVDSIDLGVQLKKRRFPRVTSRVDR